MITLEDLIGEKTSLQKEFDNLKEKIVGIEKDMGQMRANLNALSGAIQQCDKFIASINTEHEKKDKALKEMVAK